jgi:parvulin-like peptidyl-prolyl isomerase
MADTSKKPANKGRRTSDAATGKKVNQTQQKAGQAKAAAKKHASPSKKHREEQHQRLVVRTVTTGVVLALIAIISGILYDQFWVPSRAIAQVNEETLTRREYWETYRANLAQQIVQNLQLSVMFADNQQIGSQFNNRSPLLNEQAQVVAEEPINQEVITNWQDNQLVIQGANQMDIQASEDEIYQRMVQDLGLGFLPSAMQEPAASVITSTDTLTQTPDTNGITETLATDEVTESVSIPSPAPSPSPTATPTAPEARQQANDIFNKIYEQYNAELDETAEQRQIDIDPAYTQEDFREAMLRQYRIQVLRQKIQESLVPEERFEHDPTPDRVQARQIFLEVDTPITNTQQITTTDEATQEAIDEAFAERKPDAEEIVEELRAGADFAELAQEASEDIGSRQQGGNMGYFDEEGVTDSGVTYPPEVVETAYELEDDEMSDPVRSQFGWHIIQVTDRQTTTLEQQLRTARTEAFDEWIEEQREAATLELLADVSVTPSPSPSPTTTTQPTYVPGPPTPTPMPTPGETLPGEGDGQFIPTPGIVQPPDGEEQRIPTPNIDQPSNEDNVIIITPGAEDAPAEDENAPDEDMNTPDGEIEDVPDEDANTPDEDANTPDEDANTPDEDADTPDGETEDVPENTSEGSEPETSE